MKRVLYWFRSDLRLDDNPALCAALDDAESIAFVYVHDPRLFKETCAGIPRLGWHRRRFLHESLANLAQSLSRRGYSLIELHGIPEAVLPELVRENDIDCLFFSKECAPEERGVENQLLFAARNDGFEIQSAWAQFLIGPDKLPLPLEQLPQKFTDFRLKIEAAGLSGQIPLEPSEPRFERRPRLFSLRSLDGKLGHLRNICAATLSSLSFELATPSAKESALLKRVEKKEAPREKMNILVGGADAGVQRVNHYLFETRRIENYYSTRNGLLDPSDSSLFSAWLANGCLSAQMVYRKITEYEEEFGSNKSTYWVVFELLWREFFKLHLLRAGVAFFHPQGFYRRAVDDCEILSDSELQRRIGLVLSCRTDDDFINANLRELFQSGFMSNRGRQNVASYMIYNLRIPWQFGAWIFESFLIDYDVSSNWGNWAYIAGVSFDPRGGRKFNTVRQRQDYDPDGLYLRAWT